VTDRTGGFGLTHVKSHDIQINLRSEELHEGEMGRARGMDCGEEKCIQGFGGENGRKKAAKDNIKMDKYEVSFGRDSSNSVQGQVRGCCGKVIE
jgi:hypothetical protein